MTRRGRHGFNRARRIGFRALAGLHRPSGQNARVAEIAATSWRGRRNAERALPRPCSVPDLNFKQPSPRADTAPRFRRTSAPQVRGRAGRRGPDRTRGPRHLATPWRDVALESRILVLVFRQSAEPSASRARCWRLAPCVPRITNRSGRSPLRPAGTVRWDGLRCLGPRVSTSVGRPTQDRTAWAACSTLRVSQDQTGHRIPPRACDARETPLEWDGTTKP
jgi:hypothetical protein